MRLREWKKAQRRNQQLEDVDVEFIKDLRNCLLESDQHEDLGEGAADETEKSYDLSTNELCLIIGYTKENRGQLFNTVMKLEENEDFSFGSITMQQRHNYVMEDEILLSHKDNQCLDCFSYDTEMGEIVVAEDREEHFDVVFDDFGEEIQMFIKWLINLRIDKEDHMVKNKELEYVIQFCMDELSILHTWGYEERKMHQPIDIDNNKFQQEVYQS